MNKDEILAKSRAEKRDEGMEQAENKGRQIGISAFCGVFIFIVVFNLFHGQSSYVPQAMFWAFIAAESFPKYRFTNSKTYLVSTVAGTIASAAFLACHIIGVLR